MTDRPPRLHDAKVLKRTDFGNGYFEVFLEAPELAAQMQAGHFINIRVKDAMWPLLRRPFSSFDILRDVRGEPKGISILGHVVGIGTKILSELNEGDRVNLNGPLGHCFQPPTDRDTRVIMVGGGIGLAPFLHLCRDWGSAGLDLDLVVLAGGRSQRDLKFMPRFKDTGAQIMPATEDGSAGVKGRVTVLLEAELQALGGKPAMVLTCGPWGMMAAVADMCAKFEVASFASLESVMACGYGVCNGCVARVHDSDREEGFRYSKTCVEGTIYDCASIQW